MIHLLVATFLFLQPVVKCEALEPQVPLNFDLRPHLQWHECGDANNHTLECDHS